MPKLQQSFDYYVRSVTTALLALGLVGAAVYALLFERTAAAALVGWAGLVVGVYFGGHTMLKGLTVGANGLSQPLPQTPPIDKLHDQP